MNEYIEWIDIHHNHTVHTTIYDRGLGVNGMDSTSYIIHHTHHPSCIISYIMHHPSYIIHDTYHHATHLKARELEFSDDS